MDSLDAVVRAYDFGGYGDIAGALRVVDYLNRLDIRTGILPTSDGAVDKLRVLDPGLSHVTYEIPRGALLLDIAGHYSDSRVETKEDIPHVFVEDMDNQGDRSGAVPVYVKSGLKSVVVTSRKHSVHESMFGIFANPMFYRPLNEGELIGRRNRDPLELMMERVSSSSNAYRHLSRASHIAVAHFFPSMNPGRFLEEPYILALQLASVNNTEPYALGVFFDESFIAKLKVTMDMRFNFVNRDGTVEINDKSYPTIVALGPTPQIEASALFLASTMPPVATGDLSLSDQLYFNLAMNRQGFFYNCPVWKKHSEKALEEMLGKYSPEALEIFSSKDIEKIAGVLSNPSEARQYADGMRNALQREIESRFGADALQVNSPYPGYALPPGRPFLFQDVTATVVQALLDSRELRELVEESRAEQGRRARGTSSYANALQNVTPTPVQEIPTPMQTQSLEELLLKQLGIHTPIPPPALTSSLSKIMEEYKAQTPTLEPIINYSEIYLKKPELNSSIKPIDILSNEFNNLEHIKKIYSFSKSPAII